MNETAKQLAQDVREAARHVDPLVIVGGGTKGFYGREPVGRPLAVRAYQGIVSYEPSELVVTARAGTPLSALQVLLDGRKQMLAFEPPAFGADATLGGTVACGLAGPRRPCAGGVRDFVLGVVCINGQGQILRFGGQVMKNVAGFDVSRLMVGALGGLGVLLEISLKVLPVPEAELTLVREHSESEALRWCNLWAGQSIPLSATCFVAGKLYVRLSGSESAVHKAALHLGGERVPDAAEFWTDLREQRHPFFDPDQLLWRLQVPAATAPLPLAGECLLEWGGAQRWYYTEMGIEEVRSVAQTVGGHANIFRNGDRSGEVFMPLSQPLLALQSRLKRAFDPHAILNRGRLYGSI